MELNSLCNHDYLKQTLWYAEIRKASGKAFGIRSYQLNCQPFKTKDLQL